MVRPGGHRSGTTEVAGGCRATPVAAGLLVLLALVLLSPSPALAHAVLTTASPADGQDLEAPPDEVRLTFNEPVRANEGALRVFDADAVRIDDGLVADGDDGQVAVALPADLPAGAYVVSYRVVSADSHTVDGVTTFTVGGADELAEADVAQIAGPGAGALGTVGALLRGVGYLGTLLAAGAVVAAAVIARGPADRRRAAAFGRPAAIAGVVALLLHLPVQAAAVSGFGLLGAVTDVGVLGDVLGSGFGQSWTVRLLALLALATPWFVDPPGGPTRTRSRGTRRPLVWLGTAAALAIGSFLLDGHQRSVEPTWLLAAGDAVHLVAASAWLGGLALLATVVRAARREDDASAAAEVLGRFSRLAAWSVLALTVAGVAMALPLVRGVDALTSTSYGWLLVAKVTLVALVVAIAAYNRRVLVPAVGAPPVPAGGSVDTSTSPTEATGIGAWGQLRRTMQLEAALLVAVLGVTGFLATTQPAAEAAGLVGAVTIDASLHETIDLDVTIDPAAPGRNAVHVYAFDDTGQLSDAPEQLRLEFTQRDQDIGPFVVEPFVAGPGHWVATIDDLRFAGPWELRVVAAIGRFDEADVVLPFEVR